jgi:hypothetical protein
MDFVPPKDAQQAERGALTRTPVSGAMFELVQQKMDAPTLPALGRPGGGQVRG